LRSVPSRDRAQGLLSVILGHEVLELVDEAALAGHMRGALIEHAAHMAAMHVGQERRAKCGLRSSGRVGEGVPRLGQLQITAREFAKRSI